MSFLINYRNSNMLYCFSSLRNDIDRVGREWFIPNTGVLLEPNSIKISAKSCPELKDKVFDRKITDFYEVAEPFIIEQKSIMKNGLKVKVYEANSPYYVRMTGDDGLKTIRIAGLNTCIAVFIASNDGNHLIGWHYVPGEITSTNSKYETDKIEQAKILMRRQGMNSRNSTLLLVIFPENTNRNVSVQQKNEMELLALELRFYEYKKLYLKSSIVDFDMKYLRTSIQMSVGDYRDEINKDLGILKAIQMRDREETKNGESPKRRAKVLKSKSPKRRTRVLKSKSPKRRTRVLKSKSPKRRTRVTRK